MWNQLETNKQVGGLFPNDADGNAWGDPERGRRPRLCGSGLYADRSRPLPEPDRRFHRPRSTPSRRRTAEIVTGVVIPPDFTTFWNQAQAAGLQPQDRHRRQGDPLPAVGRGAGRGRPQPVVRGLVVRHPPVQVLADRPVGGRPCGRLHRQDQPPLDPADRLRPFAVRGGGRTSWAASRTPTDAEARRRRDRRDRPGHDGRQGRVERRGRAALRRARTSARRRWSAASGGARTTATFDLVIVDNKTAPDIPTGGTMEPLA